MATSIPSAALVRSTLAQQSRQQLIQLAVASGVPFHTLLKIQRGETTNPRIETVAAVWPLIAPADLPQAA